MKHKRCAAAVMALAVAASSLSLSALADDDSVYVLMNIPYSQFYSAGSAKIGDVDAVSSATNKTGNYGKAGGAYHSGTTAFDDGETVTAVGTDNGSKLKGVTWAVKAESIDAVKALGGTEITESSQITTATAAHGNVSVSYLGGYQVLTESPEYSYYVLDEAPDNYLVLDGTEFKACSVDASSESIEVTASYGTNWGDVQLNAGEAEGASDKIVNAVVLTAEDGTTKGLYHLDQIWAFNQMAWNVDFTKGLDGKKLKNIRYYCSVKDTDNEDGTAPVYVNYVYDYAVDLDISKVYTGDVIAKFKNETELDITGLPEDAGEVTVKVYYTTGGRNAEYTYITPLTVDPEDDDIDPVFVSLKDGALAIEKGTVTNKAGTSVSYGEPVDGTEYVVEFSCDNYIFRKITVTYSEAENVYDPVIPEPDSSSGTDSTPEADSSSEAGTSSAAESRSAAESSSAVESSKADASFSSKPSSEGSSSNPNTGKAAAAAAAVIVLGAALTVVRKKK